MKARRGEKFRQYNTASVHAEQLARVEPILRASANDLGGEKVSLPSQPPVSCLGGRPGSVRRQPASRPTHSKCVRCARAKYPLTTPQQGALELNLYMA